MRRPGCRSTPRTTRPAARSPPRTRGTPARSPPSRSPATPTAAPCCAPGRHGLPRRPACLNNGRLGRLSRPRPGRRWSRSCAPPSTTGWRTCAGWTRRRRRHRRAPPPGRGPTGDRRRRGDQARQELADQRPAPGPEPLPRRRRRRHQRLPGIQARPAWRHRARARPARAGADRPGGPAGLGHRPRRAPRRLPAAPADRGVPPRAAARQRHAHRHARRRRPGLRARRDRAGRGRAGHRAAVRRRRLGPVCPARTGLPDRGQQTRQPGRVRADQDRRLSRLADRAGGQPGPAAAHAPRFAAAPFFSVSARLAEFAETLPSPEAAAEVRRESRIAELQAALQTQVAARAELLGQANVLRAVRSEMVAVDQGIGERMRAADPDPATLQGLKDERAEFSQRKRKDAAPGASPSTPRPAGPAPTPPGCSANRSSRPRSGSSTRSTRPTPTGSRPCRTSWTGPCTPSRSSSPPSWNTGSARSATACSARSSPTRNSPGC